MSQSAAMDSQIRNFQTEHGLLNDGIVGPRTWTAMKKAIWFPSPPAFSALSPEQSIGLYGNPAEGSKILPDGTFYANDTWFATNLGIVGPISIQGKTIMPVFHVKAIVPFHKLWEAWGRAGLLGRVLSWDGSWNPRLTRHVGSDRLSQHAFGVAFDINAAHNPMGKTAPPDSAAEGSVLELVPIAQALGWYWGGHFGDPMHFELSIP